MGANGGTNCDIDERTDPEDALVNDSLELSGMTLVSAIGWVSEIEAGAMQYPPKDGRILVSVLYTVNLNRPCCHLRSLKGRVH